MARTTRFIDLTGQTFGRLTVLYRDVQSEVNRPRWAVRCKCGNTKTVLGSSLRIGHTTSCGCLSREIYAAKRTATTANRAVILQAKYDEGTPSRPEEGCWEWSGRICNGGYGLLMFQKKAYRAHRISWELHFGEIPEGLLIRHKCDNRKCVRPDHLELGTHLDNEWDKARGDKTHRNAKFTADQVRAIRKERFEQNTPYAKMAEKYGTTASCIQGICVGACYAWVDNFGKQPPPKRKRVQRPPRDPAIDQERFDKHVPFRPDEGCWEWQGTLNTHTGYGMAHFARYSMSAHKMVWELHNKQEAPEGMVIRHTCHNRRCVRPSHLLLGTYQENTLDSYKARRGGPLQKAKFTEGEVRDIRAKYAQGSAINALAKEYKIGNNAIAAIVKRKSYAWVEDLILAKSS